MRLARRASPKRHRITPKDRSGGGILVEVSKPDAHAWKRIGAKVEELNMKRLRKETLDWTSVYGQIMQVYSQSFT